MFLAILNTKVNPKLDSRPRLDHRFLGIISLSISSYNEWHDDTKETSYLMLRCVAWDEKAILAPNGKFLWKYQFRLPGEANQQVKTAGYQDTFPRTRSWEIICKARQHPRNHRRQTDEVSFVKKALSEKKKKKSKTHILCFDILVCFTASVAWSGERSHPILCFQITRWQTPSDWHVCVNFEYMYVLIWSQAQLRLFTDYYHPGFFFMYGSVEQWSFNFEDSAGKMSRF